MLWHSVALDKQNQNPRHLNHGEGRRAEGRNDSHLCLEQSWASHKPTDER